MCQAWHESTDGFRWTSLAATMHVTVIRLGVDRCVWSNVCNVAVSRPSLAYCKVKFPQTRRKSLTLHGWHLHLTVSFTVRRGGKYGPWFRSKVAHTHVLSFATLSRHINYRSNHTERLVTTRRGGRVQHALRCFCSVTRMWAMQVWK